MKLKKNCFINIFLNKPFSKLFFFKIFYKHSIKLKCYKIKKDFIQFSFVPKLPTRYAVLKHLKFINNYTKKSIEFDNMMIINIFFITLIKQYNKYVKMYFNYFYIDGPVWPSFSKPAFKLSSFALR